MNETPLPLVVWARMIAGRSWNLPGQIQRFGHIPDRVPVYFDDVPVAGLPFFCQRLERMTSCTEPSSCTPLLSKMAVRLERRYLAAGNGAFPDNPALALAIAQQDVGTMRLFFQPGSQRPARPPTATP